MLLDQTREPLDRQAIAAGREQQFGGNGIAFDTAMAMAGEHVAPPLQPYLAWKRLAHLGVDPADLNIEGIQRQQRPPLRRRHEQRGRVTAEVMRSNKLGTMAGRASVVCGSAHGTAI